MPAGPLDVLVEPEWQLAVELSLLLAELVLDAPAFAELDAGRLAGAEAAVEFEPRRSVLYSSQPLATAHWPLRRFD